MPELPDVEGFRKVAEDCALKRNIAEVHTFEERVLRELTPQSLGRHLKDSQFAETSRHGKHLFLKVKGGGWLELHFGMTGNLECVSEEEDMPKHTRVQFRFKDGGSLAYVCQRMLGHIGWTDDPVEFIEANKLGPDALDERFSTDEFADRISSRRGMLKSALMDQSTLAGIGNVWSDEILFQCGLDPKVGISDLEPEKLSTVYEKMRHCLNMGKKYCRKGRLAPSSYLLHHREEGAKCPRCAGRVKSVKVSGRTSYYCPKCQ